MNVWNNRYRAEGKIASEHAHIFRVSNDHSIERWRKRLVATNAQYIFAYGGGNEVTGYFLDDIPGYEMTLDMGGTDEERTIYKRLTGGF